MSKTEQFQFVGNIEAKSIMEDEADVIVTDGYTGNMILKNLEGIAKSFGKIIKNDLLHSVKNKLAALMMKKDIKHISKQLDYTEYGGSVLLGLDGIVVKAHGSSNAKAFYSAIRQAKIAADTRIVENMREKVAE